jgi:small subunit ribosomal protein S6e
MPKINVANTQTGQQKTFEIEDEHALMPFWEKRMGAEVPADSLGDEWKGYILKITGGNDKQGFPMMQGVIKNGRVRLLFKAGQSCYRERRGGMRKRKSVRGCIVGHDLAILNFAIAKKGDSDIAGLTDEVLSKRLGPKRASKIRAMFDLKKDDDVKKFVVRRETKEGKGGKMRTKAPKIQRLVTESRLQRKRRVRKEVVTRVIKSREEVAKYTSLCHDHKIAEKERRHALAKKKKVATTA